MYPSGLDAYGAPMQDDPVSVDAPRARHSTLLHVERRHLARGAAALAGLGWALMTVGAYVRASESGMGCPDWPVCKGRLIAGGQHALTEEAHRWIVTVLSIGILALALLVTASLRRERRVTRPLLLVLVALGVQILLGGLTVILNNISWTVVIHYGGAALLVFSLVLVASRLRFPEAGGVPRDGYRRLVHWFAALTFGMLLAGSTLANTDAQAACGRGYPLCDGTLLPGLDHKVAIDLVHRTWAGAMLVMAVWVLVASRRRRLGQPLLGRVAAAIVGLFVLQALAGMVVVLAPEHTALEVLHSSLGSLTWLAVATLLALTRTLPAGATRVVHTSPDASLGTREADVRSLQAR